LWIIVQTIGMISDFYAGLLVAWQLDGVKFALGETIVTTRTRLAEFGGYRALENRPADDLLVGRLIAEQGHEVELLPYAVQAVDDYRSLRELFVKRLRWMVVMRHMRPWGHLGLLLTQGLPWCILAIAIHPSIAVALSYLGAYFALRIAMTWMIGAWGLKQSSAWKNMPFSRSGTAWRSRYGWPALDRTAFAGAAMNIRFGTECWCWRPAPRRSGNQAPCEVDHNTVAWRVCRAKISLARRYSSTSAGRYFSTAFRTSWSIA
jgi:hypothetical protein